MQSFVQRFSKRKGAAILAVAALVVCLPLGLRALTHETVYVDGSLAYYSVDDLFAGSTLVVSGTITGEPESLRVRHASADMETNFTDYTLAVEHVYRSQAAGETLTVRLYGGTAGNVTEIYSPAPQLAAGEEYLLFLNQPSMGGAFHTLGDYYYITGVTQGVFQEGTAGLYTSQSGDTLSPIQLAMTRSVPPVDSDSLREEFVENQQANLANGFITQEEYDAAIAGMNTYATVVD